MSPEPRGHSKGHCLKGAFHEFFLLDAPSSFIVKRRGLCVDLQKLLNIVYFSSWKKDFAVLNLNDHIINFMFQLMTNRTLSQCSPDYSFQLVPNLISSWASLVAQWLRVCLPMQGTRVRALVWEDPTCRGATRPVSRNY